MAQKRSFTLIELLLVVVLISVLLSFALPRLKKAYENVSFQKFTRDIYYLARDLQSKSISERKVCCVVIEGMPQEFRQTCREERVSAPVTDELKRRYRLPPGVLLLVEPQGTGEFCFYPDGSIDPVKLIFKDEPGAREVALVMSKDAGSIQIQ